MPKKTRPSILKREREQKKRQREARKAEKAALRRARREGKKDLGSGPRSTHTTGSEPAAIDPTATTSN